MADIVERLDAAGCTAGCNSSPVCLCALCQDAAAEITALRARVAELEAALRAAERKLSYADRESNPDDLADWARGALEDVRRALGDDHDR